MAALQSAARVFAATARVWLRDGSSSGVVTALGGPALAAALGRSDIVYAGETHEQPHVLRFQMGLLEAVIAQRPRALHLVLEHWTFDEQAQLDALLADPGAVGDREVTATGFVGIHAVARFCAHVAAGAGVPLRGYAGFPAREVARAFMKPETAGAAWDGLLADGCIDVGDAERAAGLLAGSDAHYAFFEALIAGQPEVDGAAWGGGTGGGVGSGGGGFRRIFPAQTVKDVCMAAAVARAFRELPPAQAGGDGAPYGRGSGVVVVLAGTGHLDFGFGVPERVGVLLGGGAHVPSLDGASPGVGGEGGDAPAGGNPRQLLMTVRPRQARPGVLFASPAAADPAAWAPARIAFPDVSQRVAGDVLYWYDHVEEEEDGADGGEGARV